MAKKIILSKNVYDFKNPEGQRVVGAKIAYINKKQSKKENEFGHPPLIVSVKDQELLNALVEVPGIYEMDFEQVTGKNNKPELMLTELEFERAVDINELFNL